MRIERVRFVLFCGAMAAFSPLTGALASGGGGGGGGFSGAMPSASTPQYDPAQEYRTGMAAYQAGRFKDAARAFDHVTEASPGEARGWHMLGMARIGASDAKGAARAFDRALKIGPLAIDSRREYALALVTLKMKDKSGAQLAVLKDRATTCNDACPEAADLKAAISAVEAALATGAPVASISPSGASVSVLAGDLAYVRAVSLINERRYDAALSALDQAEAVFGPHPDILTYRGYVWRKLGRLDTAEHFYQAALAVAPGHRGASEYYGELKVIQGDLPGARALLAGLDRRCAAGCAEAEDLRRWIEHGGDPAS